MNKHLKPGVAVAIDGISKQDEHDFIKLCKEDGAGKFYDDDDRGYYNFIAWRKTGSIALFRELTEELTLITLGQALGRESEVEKNEFCGTEMQPIGWHGEVTYGSRACFNECVILPDRQIALKLGGGWCVNDFDSWVGKNFEFRPLKTEKEKFVERYSEFYNAGPLESSLEEWAESLYDKGLRFID